MRTVYIADDGTELEDRYECEEYEYTKQLDSLSVPTMWDQDGKPTDEIAYCTYLKISTPEQAKAFYLKADYEGYSAPHDLKTGEGEWVTGSWYYSTEDDEYHSIPKRIKELKVEIENLEKYL